MQATPLWKPLKLALALTLAAALVAGAGSLAGCAPKAEELWFRPEAGSLPAEVATWVENSLPLDAGQVMAAGNITYALVTWGSQPERSKVEIVEAAPVEDGAGTVQVTVRYTPSPLSAIPPEPYRPYDLIALNVANAQVAWVVDGNPDGRVAQILGGVAVEPIVGDSRSIKVFEPAPGTTQNSPFALRGLSNVFEGTVNYKIIADKGLPSETVIAWGYATGAMGDWGLYETEITFPHEAAYMPAILEVFWYSPMDGSQCDLIEIPLTLGTSGPG